MRTLLRPGDAVIVEEPGATCCKPCNSPGCTCMACRARRRASIRKVFERIVVEHRPKAAFLNTTLQNPTGATFGMASAFRLMQIAERHGLWVVEDDLNGELAPLGALLLAAMEGLPRAVRRRLRKDDHAFLAMQLRRR